jgi:hypothetical protein
MKTGTSVVHEEDSPFCMEQVRTSIYDSEPDRTRANLIRVKLEPQMELDATGPGPSDTHKTNAEAEALESQKRIEHAKKIMGPSKNMEILGNITSRSSGLRHQRVRASYGGRIELFILQLEFRTYRNLMR